MLLVVGIVTLLILAIITTLIYVLDPKTGFRDRIFYFVIMVVMLVIVFYIFNAVGVVNLW